MTEEYGSGYSITNIKSFRKFYVEYQDYIIGQTLSAQSKGTHSIASVATEIEKGQTPSDQFTNSLELLPWSHYERLMRVPEKAARDWYMHEAAKEMWSFRTLTAISTLIITSECCYLKCLLSFVQRCNRKRHAIR